MPATTDEADIERHPQRNKKRHDWLARAHRFDHLRREQEASGSARSSSRLTASPPAWALTGLTSAWRSGQSC